MNLTQSVVGKMAATYDQKTNVNSPQRPRSVGRIVGYFTEPVVIIDYGDGRREAWSARLTDELRGDIYLLYPPARLANDGLTVGETKRLTVAELAAAMQDVPKAPPGQTLHWDDFAAAVMNALNKPPRIPEPKGKYAVVAARTTTDSQVCDYVSDGRGYWDPIGDDATATVAWKELVDPVLVREGIDG